MTNRSLAAPELLHWIGKTCISLANDLTRLNEPDRPSDRDQSIAAKTRRVVRLRRKREQELGAGLFADPSWDMLLDLLIAEEEGRVISVSSLCMAAAAPPTTALRWVRALEAAGHITCVPHPTDARSRLVSLSRVASGRLHFLLAEL